MWFFFFSFFVFCTRSNRKQSDFLKRFIYLEMEPLQVLSVWIRIDVGVIETKIYFSFPISTELEPCHQMWFTFITKTPLFGGGGS